jgi:hypothetical protein
MLVIAAPEKYGSTNLHVWLPANFKHGHRRQATRAHGDIWQLVGGTVGVNSE